MTNDPASPSPDSPASPAESQAGAPREPYTPRNKVAAGLLGALDGLAQGLEANDVAATTDRAMAETTAVVAGVERGIHRSGFAKSKRGGRHARRGRAPHPVSRPMRRARRVVRHAIERTQSGAHAVAETGRRAMRAPPLVVNDLKQAATSYGKGWAKGIAFYAIAGVVAIAAFACLTAGFVIGLNLLLGPPWGAFVVAAVYVGVALVFVNKAGKAVRRGTVEATRHVGDAKRHIREVGEPIRRWRAAPRRSPARRRSRRPSSQAAQVARPVAQDNEVTFVATPRPHQPPPSPPSFVSTAAPSPPSRPSSSSSGSLPGAPGDNR